METNKIEIKKNDGKESVHFPHELIESFEQGGSGGVTINIPAGNDGIVKKEIGAGLIDQGGRTFRVLIGTICGRWRWCRVIFGIISFLTFLCIAASLLFLTIIKK